MLAAAMRPWTARKQRTSIRDMARALCEERQYYYKERVTERDGTCQEEVDVEFLFLLGVYGVIVVLVYTASACLRHMELHTAQVQGTWKKGGLMAC